MPTLPNGVPFRYFKDGYEDGSDEGGPWIRAQYVVAWADRFRFVNGMRSTITQTGPVGTGGVTWAHPYQYPDSTNLFAMEVSMVQKLGVPRENAAGGFECDQAVYSVTFRRPPFDLLGTDVPNTFNQQGPMPFTSMRKRTSVEVERIPGWTLQFQDTADGDTLDKDFHLPTPITELIFTRHQLPYMPTIALDDYVGCVNAADFFGYPRGQVRYEGITSERQIDGGSGETVNEIEVTFTRKPRDWNTQWSQTPGRGFQLIWSDPTNQLYPYPYVDFDAIFQEV